MEGAHAIAEEVEKILTPRKHPDSRKDLTIGNLREDTNKDRREGQQSQLQLTVS